MTPTRRRAGASSAGTSPAAGRATGRAPAGARGGRNGIPVHLSFQSLAGTGLGSLGPPRRGPWRAGVVRATPRLLQPPDRRCVTQVSRRCRVCDRPRRPATARDCVMTHPRPGRDPGLGWGAVGSEAGPVGRSTVGTFEGRTALVTGASRGIGLAIAQSLVDRGARVVVTARRPEALAEAVEVLGGAERAVAVPGNAADPAHRAEAVRTAIDPFGSLDLLVGNVGINPVFGPLMDVPLDAFRKILD